MVGNRVILQKAFNDKGNFNKINANNINLSGNTISIDVASINGDKLQSLQTTGKAEVYLDASGYYYNTGSWNVFDKASGNNLTKHKYVAIGSDRDWWHFAKGTNTSKAFRETAKEYKLTNNIDFGGDKGKNYANYCITGLGCTSMIVGDDNGYFSKNEDNTFIANFDGQGYTLSNINIKISKESTGNYKPSDVGIFGSIKNGKIKNVNVDYKKGSIIIDAEDAPWLYSVGGFVGRGYARFENINFKGIKEIDVKYFSGGYHEGTGLISNTDLSIGGFAGSINGASNINVSDIGNIKAEGMGGVSVGGFAGSVSDSSNIYLKGVGNIYVKAKETIPSPDGLSVITDVFIGGFAGEAEGVFKISVRDIGDIYGEIVESSESDGALYAGGFAGSGGGISEIILEGVGNITAISSSAGGNWSGKVGAYAGGFLGISGGGFGGGFGGSSIGNINDVYIYLKDGATITAKQENGKEGKAAKFIGSLGKKRDYESPDKHNISNINLYYSDTNNLPNEDIAEVMKIEDEWSLEEKITQAGKSKQEFFTAIQQDGAFKEEVWDQESGQWVEKNIPVYGDGEGGYTFNNPDKETIAPTKPTDNSNSKLGSVTLKPEDFSKEILDQILADLDFDLLNDDIDSIIQTLDFLRYFNKEDIGIQSLFSEDYTLANNNQSDNLFNNFDKIVEKIKEDKKILEAYQKDVEKFNKDYELYLDTKGDMTEEALAGLEKELKQRQEALLKREKEINALIDSFNKSMQEKLYTNFELNKGTPMFNNNPLIFTLNLTPLNKGGIGGNNGGGDSDQTITTPLKDINSSMINKEKIVLVKPAEEEKEALDEEKGTLNSRTCVVSENFKTNNPCMAERI
ncbi:hypothetical protein HEBU111660_02295 [Helicobacter burdigaliensis]